MLGQPWQDASPKPPHLSGQPSSAFGSIWKVRAQALSKSLIPQVKVPPSTTPDVRTMACLPGRVGEVLAHWLPDSRVPLASLSPAVE